MNYLDIILYVVNPGVRPYLHHCINNGISKIGIIFIHQWPNYSSGYIYIRIW